VPRYTGLLSVAGVVAGTSFEPTPGAYHMVFGKHGFFGYSVRPNRELYWFANIPSSAAPTRESLARTSPAEWKRRLVEVFTEDEGPAVEMLRATGEDVAAYPLFDMPSVPTWHRGALVLCGDAAHATSPSTGQGASLAIEDALVLAKCVRDVPDVTAAFARYESLRRARVERVVRYSARIGNAKVAGPVGRWFRDLMMPLALKHFANKQSHEWLYGYDVGFDEVVSA
jgi:2-polyprenyl-6-methoxyphenol hydroxylase-like FAD-dependent oxidoreductase